MIIFKNGITIKPLLRHGHFFMAPVPMTDTWQTRAFNETYTDTMLDRPSNVQPKTLAFLL